MSLAERHSLNAETVRLTIKSVLRTMLMLGIAAVIGVTVATSATCGVGLAHGTGTWCALPLASLIGFPFAIIATLVFGLPVAFLFWKLRLTRCWQFGTAGIICAIPFWMELADPFTSMRWAQSGLYDSLNYLGSGLTGGVAYWWTCQRAGIRDGNDALSQAGLWRPLDFYPGNLLCWAERSGSARSRGQASYLLENMCCHKLRE